MYKKISFIASSIIWILLPKCSACLMAYMGLFSAMGLGYLINNPYTLPIIWMVLFINAATSLYLALKEKKYVYAAISSCCAIVFIVNKIYYESITINFVSGVVLIFAALQIRLLRLAKSECVFANKIAGKVSTISKNS